MVKQEGGEEATAAATIDEPARLEFARPGHSEALLLPEFKVSNRSRHMNNGACCGHCAVALSTPAAILLPSGGPCLACSGPPSIAACAVHGDPRMKELQRPKAAIDLHHVAM